LNKVLLSASMIVCNEEKFLPGCLESIRDVVDEIIIVDTGSTDKSKSIAESFNARVFDFSWRGDFSAARNEALKHSRGEWILYIDADERLQPTKRSYITSLLSNHENVAFTVLFHPHSNYTAYREYRIYRNDPRIRFKGVIHETMLPSIQAVASEDNLKIGECDLTIKHLGYDSDQKHKHRRNLPLLQKQVKKDPERIYCWWNLGTALAGLGDIKGAEKAWENGIHIIRKKKKVHPADSQPYVELIRSRYKRGVDISDLLEEALGMFPEQYLLIWLKGMILKSRQQYEEAVPFFEKLAAMDISYVDGGILSYDARIFDILSYEPLAECYYKLGIYKKSTAYYSLAEQCDPANKELKIKRQFTAARVGQQ